MLTPDGQPADKIDKIMLLATWTKTLQYESFFPEQSSTSFISAGMGKPTYPVDLNTVAYFEAYWKKVGDMAAVGMQNLDKVQEGAAVDYGMPMGDSDARTIMARAMSSWYQSDIRPENVLFTAGGAGAIRVIFDTLNARYKDTPGYRVVTPFPHYTLYADGTMHRLHPVDVMKEPGYRLKAEALEKSIQSALELAQKDNGYPKAVLICNPSNPLGTIINEEELSRIAEVLRRYPEMHIIMDEAYAEMCFEDMPSLLTVAPDLKERTIIMRSATKGLSAAGERMAILMSFDKKLSSELLAKNISNIGHAPRSSQLAYASTMDNFGLSERQRRISFYKEKVDYVSERLKAMNATMPDPEHRTAATFYVLTDLSDLFGLELPQEATRAIGKGGVVTNDEELTYYLLFKDRVMIAPLSYYGLDAKKGYMRITCSGNESELKDMMDRLENRLIEARLIRQKALIEKIDARLPELERINPALYRKVFEQIEHVSQKEKSCSQLKDDNKMLADTLSEMRVAILKASPEGQAKAATAIQSFFRGYRARKGGERLQNQLDEEWIQLIDKLFVKPCSTKTEFLQYTEAEKLNFAPWLERLKELGLSQGSVRPD